MLDRQFLSRFEGFLAAANAKRKAALMALYPSLGEPPALQVMEGQRYIRVVNVDHGRSSYCFVDKTNGDVLKCDGWKKPAKHARSNINDPDYGVSGVGLYGANYLK